MALPFTEIATELDAGKAMSESLFTLFRARDRAVTQKPTFSPFDIGATGATSYPASPQGTRRLYLPTSTNILVVYFYMYASGGTGTVKMEITDGVTLRTSTEATKAAGLDYAMKYVEWNAATALAGKAVDLKIYVKNSLVTSGRTEVVSWRTGGQYVVSANVFPAWGV